MGGEKHAGRFKKLVGWGSPPHGRGKDAVRVGNCAGIGITPAWAGKSEHRDELRTIGEDHPRMGGEK